MSPRYGIIDPTQLGEMQAIVPTDDEALLKRRMASFKARWLASDPPMAAAYDVEGLEFDPAKITMETGTLYQTQVEARINQTARDTTLAYAFGDNLDAIASRYPGGVPRARKGQVNEETDDRYRRRIWLAANAFTTAGAEEAYVFWALTADPDLIDATATVERTRDGPNVIVTCVREGASPVPTTDQLLAVRRVLHQPGVKPLTDIVSVMGPVLINTAYEVDVWLYPNVDKGIAFRRMQAGLEAYISRQYYLGGDHSELGWLGALDDPAAHSVEVKRPSVQIEAGPRELVRVVRAPILTYKGRKE